MSERHCRICKGWHDTSVAWPAECLGHFGDTFGRANRGSFPAPFFVRDNMDALMHPADGRVYDRRSEYNAVTKSRPDLIEIGNEVQKDTRANDLCTRDEVGEAMRMVNQGYKPTLSAESDAL